MRLLAQTGATCSQLHVHVLFVMFHSVCLTRPVVSRMLPQRQTVAMELAEALHHSRDVGPGTNDGLRAQTTASPGKRPAPLEDVAEPQGKS